MNDPFGSPQAHPHLGGNIRFCVVCGSSLTYRVWEEGDGTMQLCCTSEGCNNVHFLDPKLAAGIIPTVRGKAVIQARSYRCERRRLFCKVYEYHSRQYLEMNFSQRNTGLVEVFIHVRRAPELTI